MPSSKPRRRSGRGEIVPPLSKLDRIGELLKIQVEVFPQKELSTEEIARWEQDLSGFPLEAIEQGFENWRLNGRFFPVPADVIDYCKKWEPAQQFKPGCSAECLSRHHKGYSETDVLKLWNLFNKKRAEVNRELTGAEVEGLLVALDKVRGGAPEWRA